MKHLQILAAKIFLLFMLLVGQFMPTHAGIPVIDGSNLTQNVVSALEEVAQTLKQVEQYTTQLDQYETELQNIKAPNSYLWDQANSTIGNLLGTINTLSSYQSTYGNLTNYLAQYQNTASYQDNLCFSAAGCTSAQWAALANSKILASTAQQNANNASIQGLAQQQNDLQNDADTLVQLQASAQSATGQMQAIGYANQLASAQANQLLQMRGLLIAQQNAITTRNQALADQEAQQAAADAVIRQNIFQPSPAVSW